MEVDVDSGKVLYALGILFAAAAFVYFVRDLVFGLSITVKAILLFLAFAGFFVVGLAIERGPLDVVAFVLSALAYVAFVAYVLGRFELGDTGTFLVFTASAILFIGLGYFLQQHTHSISRRRTVQILAGLVVIALVLVGADILGGGVTYALQLNESVTLTPDVQPDERDEVPTEGLVGTVTATNQFVFTRSMDLPSLRGCVAGTDAVPDERVTVRYERRSYERSGVVPGYAERTFDVAVWVPLTTNETDSTTFTIERSTTCDVSRSEPTILVVVGEDENLPEPPR